MKRVNSNLDFRSTPSPIAISIYHTNNNGLDLDKRKLSVPWFAACSIEIIHLKRMPVVAVLAFNLL